MNIGEKIKLLRNGKDLTQEELASKCGLSKNGLWNYENNKRQPKYETLVEIAKALDVDLSEILERPKFTSEILLNKINEKNISHDTMLNDCKLDQSALKSALFNDPNFSTNGSEYSIKDYYIVGLYLGFSKEFLKKRQNIDSEIKNLLTPDEYYEYISGFNVAYDLWFNDYYSNELNSIDFDRIERENENKRKELEFKFNPTGDFTLFEINQLINSTVIDILIKAKHSKTLTYSFNDFNIDEIEELTDFLVNAYKLKINEILERHKKK